MMARRKIIKDDVLKYVKDNPDKDAYAVAEHFGVTEPYIRKTCQRSCTQIRANKSVAELRAAIKKLNEGFKMATDRAFELAEQLEQAKLTIRGKNTEIEQLKRNL
jgi:hypothetical protein